MLTKQSFISLLQRLGLSVISLALVGLSVGALPPRRAAAEDPVRFTITTPAVNLRNQPSLLAANTVQVYKGEFYTALARTADNAWLKLDAVAEDGTGTWILTDLGALVSGKLSSLPIMTSTLGVIASRYVIYPKWIPTITPQMKQIYRQSVMFGKDLGIFTVVGDCNSLPPVYLQRIATGEFNLSTALGMQTTVARFSRSFSRVSQAVNGGFNAEAMMDPDWANHAVCDKDAGPFGCEIWISRASVVFIEVGTGDQYTWQDFESNYRPLIELAQKKGVLPVLVTKADDLEARSGAPSGYINSIIRRLAKEYNVPLLDLWQATRTLPNNGLIDEGGLNFHLSPAGRDLHLLATLQTLNAISR
jgi:hypothetical protein